MTGQRLYLLLSLFFISVLSYSQDSVSASMLDEVMVTATKYPKKQSQTGKVVTVISRAALEKSGGRSVSDILNTVAGITITGAGNSYGSNQTLSIRGASAGNVLILIDGIPVNDPSVITSYFDLNLLSVDQIERIEVLKGGQSTLYGSDAVAGVINIITRKVREKGIHGNAGLSAGSFDTYKVNAALLGKTVRSSYNLQYGFLRSGGFSSAYDSTENAGFDKDDFLNHHLSGSFRTELSDHLQMIFSGDYNRYSTGLDAAAFTDEKDFRSTSRSIIAGTGLIWKRKNGMLQFNYRYNNIYRTYLDDSIYKSSPFVNFSSASYKGQTHFAELYGSVIKKHAEVLYGIDYRKHIMDQQSFASYSFGNVISDIPGNLAHMSQISPYASVVLKNDKGGSVEIGGRFNHHSEYGNNITYTLNPSLLTLRGRLKVFANLYSAFKAPTLYQLFDPVSGNKDLREETSTIFEGGFQVFAAKEINLRTLYFYRKSHHSIEYIITDPSTFAAHYDNIGSQTNKGVEIEGEFRKGNWQVNANYTYTDGFRRSSYDAAGNKLAGDTIYNNVYRIPKNALNAAISWQYKKKLNLSVSLHISGKRTEPVYASLPIIMKQYYTTGLYGDYRFTKSIKAFVDLQNITDQQYFEVLGYNTRGFNVNGGIAVNF